MQKIEELPHLRSMFRQLKNDKDGALYLLSRLKVVALENLPADLKADWGLDEDDAVANARKLYLASRSSNELSASQLSAVNLLYSCTRILPVSGFKDTHINFILDSYAGLVIDAVKTGSAVREGGKKGRDANKGPNPRHIEWQKLADKKFSERPELSKRRVAELVAKEWNGSNPDNISSRTVSNVIKKPS